jgi:tRNA(fMet)-specific endonuclease VapC
VKAELWHGAQKYGRRDLRLLALSQLFSRFVSLPFDDNAADHYSRARHELEVAGKIIGPNDLLIASICLARGLTLVSSNTEEFGRISGLSLMDWAKAASPNG